MNIEYEYGKHSLVNKRSGKLASSTNWLIDLAACAVANNSEVGITQLLPLQKARKLLKNNDLKAFKRHKKKHSDTFSASSHADLRKLAHDAFPYLALFYITKVVANRDPKLVNKKGFRAWVMDSLLNPASALNQDLRSHPAFYPLAELKRGDDWWREVQKKQRVN